MPRAQKSNTHLGVIAAELRNAHGIGEIDSPSEEADSNSVSYRGEGVFDAAHTALRTLHTRNNRLPSASGPGVRNPLAPAESRGSRNFALLRQAGTFVPPGVTLCDSCEARICSHYACEARA